MSGEPMLLMTPGPTRIPRRVLEAGGRAMIHHRSPECSRELATLLELMPALFGTSTAPLPVHTTGRGALEAAICNLFSAGDEIAVCCNGKFGEMWAGFAESYGLRVHRITTDWMRGVDATEVNAFLDEHPKVRAVAMAYADTSTGVANDVAVTASQKCLMASPGMAFVAMSERAWHAAETATLPRNYWDFRAIKRSIGGAKPETPGTTPVHIVLQLAESLRMIHEEGVDDVLHRHAEMSQRTRDGARELGLALQCGSLERYAATVTAIALPAPLTPAVVRDGLRARGILTAAGLSRFQPTAFRIGHMGDIRLADVERTLGALAEILASAPAAVLA